MDEIENDIGTALMRLRAVFAKHKIPAPDVLEYSNQKAAYAAIPPLRHAIGPTCWAMACDATPLGEVSLAGFTLRFQARQIERPGTGAELDDGITGRAFWEFKRGRRIDD